MKIGDSASPTDEGWINSDMVQWSAKNASFESAVHSGFIRSAGAILDPGPVLDDLTQITSEIRDLADRWQRIWMVLNEKICEKAGKPILYGGGAYQAELQDYIKYRNQVKAEQEALNREHAVAFSLAPAYSEPAQTLAAITWDHCIADSRNSDD